MCNQENVTFQQALDMVESPPAAACKSTPAQAIFPVIARSAATWQSRQSLRLLRFARIDVV
jgi:hypothetical protein